ncbi:hypothetical protein Clacol_005238 [Clathrus columnatus]|uniref:AB hydrolase-1 domain-containing protein n=1 Tax=Clathrus columnatus TaxID=1419009 RepID=A0AAV5A8R8_9AGAM|nr:hypothetical protein Clacol_005238 [Clathrus columnatus]
MPSNYLKPYGQLADKASIPVVLYDSIGCGKSTSLPKKVGGVEEKFSFLGHSYGAALAAWYTVIRQLKGLRRLISPLPSWKLWDEAQMDLRHQLTQELQDILDGHETEKTTDSSEYKDVITEFYRRHVCRIKPFPMDLQETLDAARDPTMIFTMYGEDEFHTLVTVKD